MPSLNRLKEYLSDPVADTIIEALKIAREVGGSDLGKLLGTLSDFLRENARTRSELLARQSWTVNAARLSCVAPWFVLCLMATQPAARMVYNSFAGAMLMTAGAAISLAAYRLMLRIGELPRERRVFANLPLIFGLLLAAGVGLILSSVLNTRSISFSDRVASQLRGETLRESLLKEQERREPSLLEAISAFCAPLLRSLSSSLSGSSLSDSSVQERLRRAGSSQSVSAFRAEQLLWALAGVTVMSALTVIGVVQERFSILVALMLVLVSGLSGFLARDWWLGEAVTKREKQLVAEFPALAEMMALSVTAGESALAALERICLTSRGELAREFSEILAQTRTGVSLLSALQEFAERTRVPALSRFVEGIAVAIERGTPLADVLRAQAQDVRDNAKRELMETAGKKEIAMLAPVVFFILPLTVIFAVFPGLSLMRLNF